MSSPLIATSEEAAPRYDSSGAQFAEQLVALAAHVPMAFATARRPGASVGASR